MIRFDCTCAMGKHAAPVDRYCIERGALDKLGEFTEAYGRIYVVCDETTYKVAGAQVIDALEKSGKLFASFVLPPHPLPNCETVGNILLHMHHSTANADIFSYPPLPDLLLAVGSGTVNDSCRLVSYRLGIPYGVVATAPSMDGYLSAGSPMLFDGSKATVKCTTPKFLLADTDILKDAPWDMLLAGIGDMLGKYPAMLDWELARDYSGEYFCDTIAKNVIDATNSCLENGYLLQDRDPSCIKSIMEGFAVTGLGMAYTGNSRPASGAEHIIAHAWELADVQEGNPVNLHGLEVCEATRLVIQMYLVLHAETEDAHLKALIEKYIDRFNAVEKFCTALKMPSPATDKDKITASIFKALKLRDRYTILFYLNDRGELPRYAEVATARLMELI